MDLNLYSASTVVLLFYDLVHSIVIWLYIM